LSLQRRKILITGAVQGVGFRPFIYNLALKLHLSGYVANTTAGVTIEAQGDPAAIEEFSSAIETEHPPLAKPKIASAEVIPPRAAEQSFTIRASQDDQSRRALITPDAATCADCLAELTDPADRRYRYPFVNCTNCGPRYTIIFDVPYDRPNTTMKTFAMCPQCRSEYHDPADRRFHAQPNACPVCGPRVYLTNKEGKSIQTNDPINQTIHLLEAGHIVAIKGLGGFHLAVRSDSDAGVKELRLRKFRKAKAFAIMVGDIETAREFAVIDPVTEKLLLDITRPIVLCPKKDKTPLSPLVAPRSRFWGIMLPYTPLHSLMMQGNFPALVMTSGNNSDEPIESENQQAQKHLDGIADYFLMHNRDIYTRCDDSVVKVFSSKPMMIRRARGYVPRPIPFQRRSRKDILALGAQLKNNITYVKADQAFVSQHIGDLVGTSNHENFQRTIEKLGALIGAQPRIVACDLHPAMLSTRAAQTYQHIKLIRVQHHHAHIAAVMGEYNLDGPVVGLAVDGIGYGTDGTIWGCELLTVWRHRFERKGHLERVAMPGGDAASRQPWRMAISYLFDTYGPDKGIELAHELLKNVERSQIEAIAEMIIKKINSPSTSSLGRFFDAVSAMCGLCTTNTYEAQAAIELENTVDENETSAYPVEITHNKNGWILTVRPVIEALTQDLQANVKPGMIAAKFHNFVVAGLAQLAGELASELNTNIVALAGGVFQNDLILARLVDILTKNGLRVYFNRELPVNDGSISFGQAVVADATVFSQDH